MRSLQALHRGMHHVYPLPTQVCALPSWGRSELTLGRHMITSPAAVLAREPLSWYQALPAA